MMNSEKLIAIAEAAARVRESQKNYFKTRDRSALIRSKELEKQLDDLLRDYDAEASQG